MRKHKKSFQLLWMTVCLSLLLTPIATPSVSAETSNSCGTSATWSFDAETGTLTISGTGAMTNYTSTTTPWYEFRTQITSAVIENGITTIGNYAFNECAITSITIPDSVTVIGGYAFRSCKKLATVTIGSKVEEIGSYAFNGCSVLNGVVLPDSVKTIKSYAFNNCSAMTSIDLGKGVQTIVHGAFNKCTGLTSIVLPSTVTQIGTKGNANSAFVGCSKLTNVTFLSTTTAIYPADATGIPNTATIHGYAGSTANAYATDYDRNFRELSAPEEPEEPENPYSGVCGANVKWSFDEATGMLTLSGTGAMTDYAKETSPWYDIRESITAVTIENGITTIGDFSFNECKMTSVVIPDSVTVIGDYAFRSCSSLSSVTLGSGLKTIETYVFNGCAITSIVIPDGVKTISNFAFNNCQKMTSITLPEGLEKIGRGCFTNCKMLTKIVFPSTVKEIGDEGRDNVVFRGCAGLTDVTFLSPDTDIYPASAEAIPTNVVIHGYADSKAEAYATTYNRTFKDLSEPEEPEDPYSGVCGVGVTWKFDPESGTLTIDGVGGMNDYGKEAIPWYEYRTEITRVVIGENVFAIGTYAFNECAITSITIPDSVAKIGGYAFRSCEKLSTVTIGDGVTEIGGYAFNGCVSLGSVVLPASVKTLANWVFNNCESMTSITLNEGLTTMGYGVFNNCSALVKIVLPSTLERIGVEGSTNVVFGGCDKLTDLIFLSTTTAIYPADATAIPAGVTIHGFADSTAQAYATAYNRTFSFLDEPFAYGCTTVFEVKADAIRAEEGYLPILSLVRKGTDDVERSVVFFAVDQNGVLYIYRDGAATALYNADGTALVLQNETDLAVVYDDLTGLARFYVNGSLPRYGADLALAVNVSVADADFRGVASVGDRTTTANGATIQQVFSAEDKAAEFAGFQVNSDTTAIRILAGVDMLYYDNLGFELSLYANGNLLSTTTEYTSKVFLAISADGDTVTAESCGYRYLTAVKIINIDRTQYPADTNLYFVVKTFSTVGGEKIYGREKQISIDYNAEKGEHMYTKGITAPFEPVVRFVATSDIHFTTTTGVGAPRFKTILDQLSQLVADENKNDGYAGLDAILMAGDITETGTAAEIAIAKAYLEANIPEGIELVLTMGNHDWINWFNVGASGALEQFEAAFGDSTTDIVIGGYHFITINCDTIPKSQPAKGYGNDYSDAVVAEAKALIEAALAEGGLDKPIFVVQHIPPVDTVAGSEDSPWITIGEMLAEYPNVIVFAGHSHHPLVDEKSIHQENFTTVGTGALSEVAQVHLVEVDAYGRVRIRHYCGDTQSFVGTTWLIDSYDPADFTYNK